MSSAGNIFKEQVFVIQGQEAGSKTLNIDIENDGFMMTLQRISGSASIDCDVYSDHPDPMSRTLLNSFATVSDNSPHTYSDSSHRRVELDLSWDQQTEFRIVIKSISGGGVIAAKGSLRSYGGMSPTKYDEIQVTYPSTSSETYTYKLSSATVGVITLTYTDATKQNLISAVREDGLQD